MSAQGRILSHDWELYDGQHVVFQPRNMTVKQLADGHEAAWKKVYRWSAIARRLWNARNFKPLAMSVNLGYRFYAHHLHEYYTCDMQINTVIPNPFGVISAEQNFPASDVEPVTRNRVICG
jgi:hypothetical protein